MSELQAKYCVEYANRLFLASLYRDGKSYPYTVKWSKEGNPTNWTDISAGEMDLLDTEDYITGMAKLGPYLVIFKSDSHSIWYRTGISTDPIKRSSWKIGVGLPAPYGFALYMGNIAWVSRDDFYTFNGDQAVSIGERIRHTFFDIVNPTELFNVWAAPNYLEYEIMWVANTTYGQYAFVWNWKHDEWYIYQFADDVTCLGRGNIASSATAPPLHGIVQKTDAVAVAETITVAIP